MVMGAILSVVLISSPLPEKVPVAFLTLSQSDKHVEVFHKAGDSLTSASVTIVVDGVDRTHEFRAPDSATGWETLKAGEHLTYESPAEPESVRILYRGNSGQYLMASSGSDIRIPPGITPALTPALTPAPVMSPAVVEITPGSGGNNSVLDIVNLTGTAFLPGAAIKLNGTGLEDIYGTNVTVTSGVLITCSFNLTSQPAGSRNVVVTNTDGKEGMLVNGFTIDPAPSSPLVHFFANRTSGPAPLTVMFNATCSGSPSTWAWEFGDGGVSTLQNVSHQYTSPGTYCVNLTVTGEDGSASEIRTNFIKVTSQNTVTSLSPQANFTSNVTRIPENGCVQFYDTSTNNPTKWRWTFGDDLFYTTHQNPVHQYINPGVYSVRLTVSNADGTDSETRTDYIHVGKVNHPPVLAQFPGQTAIIGTALTFTITALDPDNDILRYSAEGLPGGASFNQGTRTFAWTPDEGSAGNHTVIFRVSDGEFTTNETLNILVHTSTVIPPAAQFTANTTQGQNPLIVQFTDQSVSPGTTLYTWDINNDGVVDYTTKNPRHTYQTAGTYTVKLTVTNEDGTDSEIKTNYIKVSTPVSAITSTLYLDQYGIKGDGSDEGPVIQAALNYAATHSIKTVVFPAGKVVTTGSLRIPVGLTLIGNGCTLRLKANAHTNAEPWTWIYVQQNCHISGFKFDGNRLNGNGLNTNGLMLQGNNVFDNNEVFNVNSYAVFVYGNYPSNIRITNNNIHDIKQYGIDTGGSDGPYSWGYNVTVTGNTISGCGEVGIKIRGTKDSVISGNTINVGARNKNPLGDEPSGIRLYSWDETNTNVRISDNIITGKDENPSTCIDSDDSDNHGISITGNTISHCYEGIEIQFNNGIISGNTITHCSKGILNYGSGNSLNSNSFSS
jgi:parallel beta-helix repeat protein